MQKEMGIKRTCGWATVLGWLVLFSSAFGGAPHPIPSDAEVIAKLAGRGILGPERVILRGTAYDVETRNDSLVLVAALPRGTTPERRAIILGSEATRYRPFTRAPDRAPVRQTREGGGPAVPLSGSTEFLLDTALVTSNPMGYQMSPAIASDGTGYLVVWEDWQDEIKLRATRVSATGQALDPVGIPLVTGAGMQAFPAVAFDGTNYLAVWEDWRRGNYADICGARVTPSGAVLDPGGFVICSAFDDQWRPSIAFDGTNYLVVWQDWRNGIDFDVYGCRVTPEGTVLEPGGKALAQATYNQLTPRVAFGGSNYLLCWTDWFGAMDSSHIRASRVSPSGTVLDPGGFLAPTGTRFQYNSCPAYDGSNYLVCWNDLRNDNEDIYGTRITPTGAVLDPAGIAITTAEYGQWLTSMSFAFGSIVVVWADRRFADNLSDVYAARVNPAGAVLDPDGLAVSSLAADQFRPAVCAGPGNWYAVWTDGRRGAATDIYGARVGGNGQVLDPAGVMLSLVANEQLRAATASDGASYLTAWVDYRNGNADIYGIRTDAGGQALDARAFAVCVAESAQTAPAVAYDGTNYLVVWEDRRGANRPDIFAARVSRSGTVLDPGGIPVDTHPHEQAQPAAAFDGTNYMIVWQDDRRGTNWEDICGKRFTPGGLVLDTARIAIDTTSAQWQLHPAVAFDGANYLVVWEDHCDRDTADIRGARVTPAGVLLDPEPITLADAGNNQLDPSVVFDGSNFLAVWQDWRSGHRADVYGARVTPAGKVLDPQGLALATSPGRKTVPAVARAGTRPFVVWADSADNPCARLVGVRVDAAGIPSSQVLLGLNSLARSGVSAATGPGQQILTVAVGRIGDWGAQTFCARRILGALCTVQEESLRAAGWYRKPEVPNIGKRVKDGGALVALGEKVYALRGNNTNDLLVFDVVRDTWAKESDVPFASTGSARRVKKGACLATDGYYLYVVKGANTQEFYRYDPQGKTWQELPGPVFTKRISGGSLAFDGDRTLYLLCGSTLPEWKAFDVFLDTWRTPNPALLPGSKWKYGSFLACDRNLVYALRVGGTVNEFYKRDAAANDTMWLRLPELPLIGPSGRKKKAKDGASGVVVGNTLFALKGGNTLELWSYDLAAGTWRARENVGSPTGIPRKRVKGGGSLAYSPFQDGLVALIGNNTTEFWFYVAAGAAGGGAQTGATGPVAGREIAITPNPAAGLVRLTRPEPGGAPAQLTVFDIAGRQVLKLDGVGRQFEFDTRRLATGIYLLQIETSTSRTTGRLQVVH